jgi:hypothetical protein
MGKTPGLFVKKKKIGLHHSLAVSHLFLAQYRRFKVYVHILWINHLFFLPPKDHTQVTVFRGTLLLFVIWTTLVSFPRCHFWTCSLLQFGNTRSFFKFVLRVRANVLFYSSTLWFITCFPKSHVLGLWKSSSVSYSFLPLVAQNQP